MSAATTSEGERALGYRPDLDGLRAIAVLLILLYHAGVPGLPGGYVGVDVFFVISGFLITGLLVKELGQTGALDLWAFYARRARRILPASFLVLAATLVGCVLFFSPVGFWRAAPDIAAAAAYVPNLLFAQQTTDYFHPARVSPVIHYWSLGVEEQFYLVWPAFLLLAHRLAGRRGPGLAAWVAIAVVASLAASVVVTAAYPTAAFYLLPTRAWELGAGAILAIGTGRLRNVPASIANAAGVVGLGLIAGSAIVFEASTPFPGIAALVPVGGTVLVIGAGAAVAGTWSARWLSWSLARYVGRISYSLYLWHWPLLVFAPIALAGVVPAGLDGAIAVGLTIVLAAATFRWVEDPLRHGRLVGRRPSRNLITALASSVVIVALALGGSRLDIARYRHPTNLSVPASGDPLTGVLPTSSSMPSMPPTPDGPLPADLIPSLTDLHAGKQTYNPVNDGCSLLEGQLVAGPCTYGDLASPTEVVLLGDSHVAQWWPAIERIMAARHWKVVFLVKTSCPYADITAMGPNGPKSSCDTWRRIAMARIAADHPALVILAANHRPPPVQDGVALEGQAAITAMAAGVGRTIAALQATGAAVVVLGDTPRVPFDPADCLSSNPDHILQCAVPRTDAVDPAWIAAEQAATEAEGATFVDVDAWICPSDPCPAIIGRYVVYADTNHLTRVFVQALTSRLDAALPR